MSTPALDPDELREKAFFEHKKMVVRLQDELDKLIKIFAHMRECFENEMMDGMGYKKLGTTEPLMRKAADLAKLMTTVVDSKIRFDKAHKQLADLMTPEEERKACGDYIRALDPADRQVWYKALREWMRRRSEPLNDIEPTRAS